MNNNLTTTNQNAKLALLKSKNLINIANSILANSKNTTLMQNFENFRFHPTLGHSGWVTSVAITPDGKHMVSGSYDETIKLWDIQSGKEIRSFRGHSREVTSIAITPDGKYIVSGSQDTTLKLWDLHSGALYVSFVSFLDDEWLCFTSDGFYNSSHGASKHFCFLEQSDLGERVLEPTHSVYKESKKQEGLLSSLYR